MRNTFNTFSRKSLALLCSLALTGNAAHAQEASETLAKIRDSGVITLGYRETSIPFSYLDDNQKPVGYTMELCGKIVDNVKKELKLPNLTVKLVSVTAQTRIPLITNGTIDLECSSTTNTLERQKAVAFAVSHYITSVRMVTRTNAGVKSLDDLNGKIVVTTTGTTSDRLIKRTEAGHNIDVKNLYGKDHGESFIMLETGRADAFVMDDILLTGLIANAKNPAAYTLVGPALSVEPNGIMLRKGDPVFKKLVDSTLIGLFQSGEIDKIYHKWFQSPIPPKGINLNLPMSDKVREAMKNPTDAGI